MNVVTVLWAACLICSATRVLGVEPIAEFSQGLRRSGDFELTLEYLERVESGTVLSDEQKGTVLLERGLTKLQAARATEELSKRDPLSDDSRKTLREFLSRFPQHPRRSQAQAILGNLLLHATPDLVLDGEDVTSEESQRQAQRQLMHESQGHLTQARDYYEGLWRQYPTFIPEEEVALRASKRAVEEVLIRAQLDLAQCTFCEARTYARESEISQRLLSQAGLEFEQVHQRYRSQAGGLYARYWQARCFQEQATALGVRISLGIYSEILDHHGDSPLLQDLRDRAFRQRLTCLNSDHRSDFQLVIQESRTWLEAVPERAASPVGTAIQWEFCRALESQASAKETTSEERSVLLEQAAEQARQLSWSKGFYSTKAQEMLQRIAPAGPEDEK